MKKKFVAIAFVVALFNLTSCISYTKYKFEPSPSSTIIPPVQKKAYIEELTMSSKAAIWLRNFKQKKAGVEIGPVSQEDLDKDLEYSMQQGKASHQATKYLASYEDYEEIAKYISSCHPEIFTMQKEGAIPVKLIVDADGILIGQDIFDEIFNRLLFLGIFPFGFYGQQSMAIKVETISESHPQSTLNSKLTVIRKTSIFVSPFGWIAASLAQTAHFDTGLSAHSDDMWQNYFLTPEFANSAASAVSKHLNK